MIGGTCTRSNALSGPVLIARGLDLDLPNRYGVLRVRRLLVSMRARPSTISAVIPAGKHLFPFRTEKLSLPGPMVLGGQPPGRVGHRRFDSAEPAPLARALLVSAAIGVASSVFGGCGGAKPRLPWCVKLRLERAVRFLASDASVCPCRGTRTSGSLRPPLLPPRDDLPRRVRLRRLATPWPDGSGTPCRWHVRRRRPGNVRLLGASRASSGRGRAGVRLVR